MIIQSIVISEGRITLSYDSLLTNVVVILLWCVCTLRAARLRRRAAPWLERVQSYKTASRSRVFACLTQETAMKNKRSTINYLVSATMLCTLLAGSHASGQTPPRKPRMTEPLEKPAMPPAYIYRLEKAPRMISRFGPFTSFQVNVDASGNNILGDAANEPSISVDPTDHNKMAVGWRQFDSVQSDFRQAGYGYTTDAGTTWTFPGVLQENVFRSDPVLGSDEAGNFFYLSLLQSFCDNMYGSLDFGQTWTRLQPDGDAGGGDKQWFTIDKTGGTGHGFQYQAWSTAAPCDFNEIGRAHV